MQTCCDCTARQLDDFPGALDPLRLLSTTCSTRCSNAPAEAVASLLVALGAGGPKDLRPGQRRAARFRLAFCSANPPLPVQSSPAGTMPVVPDDGDEIAKVVVGHFGIHSLSATRASVWQPAFGQFTSPSLNSYRSERGLTSNEDRQ